MLLIAVSVPGILRAQETGQNASSRESDQFHKTMRAVRVANGPKIDGGSR